jgi:cell division protein FtsZ
MESRVDSKTEELQAQDATSTREKSVEEHTPKLFSDERLQEDLSSESPRNEKEDEQLFDQDVKEEEEDFEIPAFLRRQKF